jgi:hypothetical protein
VSPKASAERQIVIGGQLTRHPSEEVVA